jgi:hypothetical protein
MADFERVAFGMPDLQLAIIPHPLMTRTEAELEAFAQTAILSLDQYLTPEDGSDGIR